LRALLLQGKQMAWQVATRPPNTDFRDVGFRVFSQWDEDGILQYLIHRIPIRNKTFIEFGVENYEESNTRFLLLNDHWQGMLLDVCEEDIRYIEQDDFYWQYDLQVKKAWITRENIDALLVSAGFGEDVGVLSIDIDGNEYWLWEAIVNMRPLIVVVEYNSLFGLQPVVVPYREDFHRTAAHYSNLYYGSSLAALAHLGQSKGYLLLGSNIWGHNAFFVRADIAGEFHGRAPEEVYVASKFRESRDHNGKLTYARGDDRFKLIQDLPVTHVGTGKTAPLREFRQVPSASL
jgi:hypothetical protein